MTQELRLPWRSLICCRCCSWTGEGMTAACDGVDGGPGCDGSDWRRRRLSAGLRLYLTLACTRSSLKTLETLTLSLAEVSTKPFSQSTVTTDSVVAVSTWNKKMRASWLTILRHALRITRYASRVTHHASRITLCVTIKNCF